MKINWERWGYDFVNQILRHVGTAGLCWGGLSAREGKIDWPNLWVFLLTGAILPTLFTFFSKGLPPDEEASFVQPQPPKTP